MVKITNITEETKIEATNPWNDIDTCCPKHKKTKVKEIKRTINDTIPRIACDISPQQFLRKYVEKREPVILVNCSKNQAGQHQWTLDTLLSLQGGKLKWTSDYETDIKQLKKFASKKALSGNLLKHIVKNNGTIRVFDQLGRRKHTAARLAGDYKDTDKMQLFSEYSKPGPVPTDYYEQAGILTDYQWLILSHRDTGDHNNVKQNISPIDSFLVGTELHMDPEFTSPWNTVISGYKW